MEDAAFVEWIKKDGDEVKAGEPLFSVVNGKTVTVGQRLWLSLTFDHRLVDGAPAARFLESLSRKIETVE